MFALFNVKIISICYTVQVDFVIVFIAKYLFLVSIFLYLYTVWIVSTSLRKKLLVFSFIAFPLSYIIAKILSHFIYDPRPFVVEHIKPLIAHAADNGFPSDHMLLTTTIALVVFVYNRKLGIVLILIAISIGVARVLAKIHHVEDIVGSAVIAIAATYLTLVIIPFLKSKFFAKQ